MSVPEAFSFKPPILNVVSSANGEQWVYTQPSNSAGPYRSDLNSVISFNLSSSTAFIKTQRAFFAATIVPRDSSGNPVGAGTTVNSVIPASLITRLVVKVGGQICEDISSYGTLLAMIYSTATQSRKNYLAMAEGYGITNAFQTTSGRRICHALQSSLFTTDQVLPLPIIQGGVTVDLSIGAMSSLLTTSTGISYYSVENPLLIWQSVIPEQSFLYRMMSALEASRSLQIPFIKCRTFINYGNGGLQQSLTLPVGNVASVASVLCTMRNESDIADATKDKALIYSSQGLQNVQITAAGITVPQSGPITYSAGGSTAFDPTLTVISLTSMSGSVYDTGDVYIDSTNYDAKQFRIFISFKSSNGEVFGDGLSLVGAANPNIVITTNHSSAIPATVRFTTFVFVDAILTIQKSVLTVSEVF